MMVAAFVASGVAWILVGSLIKSSYLPVFVVVTILMAGSYPIAKQNREVSPFNGKEWTFATYLLTSVFLAASVTCGIWLVVLIGEQF